VTDTPSQEILERYAGVLVNYALGHGAGVQRGEVVGLRLSEDAKPLLLEIAKAVWRAGGHLLSEFLPADDSTWNLQRAFYEIASEEQLDFFPAATIKPYFETIDHFLMVGAERDPRTLEPVSLRHRGDGRRGRHDPGGVLGPDHQRLLPGPA
jgi:aminopeptidase